VGAALSWWIKVAGASILCYNLSLGFLLFFFANAANAAQQAEYKHCCTLRMSAAPQLGKARSLHGR
jgi:hypothetical protein